MGGVGGVGGVGSVLGGVGSVLGTDSGAFLQVSIASTAAAAGTGSGFDERNRS